MGKSLGDRVPGVAYRVQRDVTSLSSATCRHSCGGADHIRVHHTNEIAQTEACYGTRLANFWMHGYFLQIGEEKMSKSTGEFLRLQVLIDRYPKIESFAWVQEEPRNMGARKFVLPRIRHLVPYRIPLGDISRPERSRPAEGYPAAHAVEQARIVREALTGR